MPVLSLTTAPISALCGTQNKGLGLTFDGGVIKTLSVALPPRTTSSHTGPSFANPLQSLARPALLPAPPARKEVQPTYLSQSSSSHRVLKLSEHEDVRSREGFVEHVSPLKHEVVHHHRHHRCREAGPHHGAHTRGAGGSHDDSVRARWEGAGHQDRLLSWSVFRSLTTLIGWNDALFLCSCPPLTA